MIKRVRSILYVNVLKDQDKSSAWWENESNSLLRQSWKNVYVIEGLYLDSLEELEKIETSITPT